MPKDDDLKQNLYDKMLGEHNADTQQDLSLNENAPKKVSIGEIEKKNSSFGGKVKNAFKPIKRFFGRVFSFCKKCIVTLWQKIKLGFSKLFSTIKTNFPKWCANTKAFFKKIFLHIKTFFLSVIAGLKKFFENFGFNIKTLFVKLKLFFIHLYYNAKAFFKKLGHKIAMDWKKFVSWLKETMVRFKNWIKLAFAKTKAWLANAWIKTKDWSKKTWKKIKTGLKKFKENFKTAMKKFFGNVWARIKKFTKAIIPSLKVFAKEAYKEIKNNYLAFELILFGILLLSFAFIPVVNIVSNTFLEGFQKSFNFYAVASWLFSGYKLTNQAMALGVISLTYLFFAVILVCLGIVFVFKRFKKEFLISSILHLVAFLLVFLFIVLFVNWTNIASNADLACLGLNTIYYNFSTVSVYTYIYFIDSLILIDFAILYLCRYKDSIFKKSSTQNLSSVSPSVKIDTESKIDTMANNNQDTKKDNN